MLKYEICKSLRVSDKCITKETKIKTIVKHAYLARWSSTQVIHTAMRNNFLWISMVLIDILGGSWKNDITVNRYNKKTQTRP